MSSKPNVRTIQDVVADYYRVTVSEMKSERRDPRFVVPRYVAIYLTHKLTGMSLKQIARQFGDRDHTTIIYAIRRAPFKATPERIEHLRAKVQAATPETAA